MTDKPTETVIDDSGPLPILTHSWGSSQYLASSADFALALVHGRAGGKSSLHRHHGKSNTFIVQRGKVVITRDWPHRAGAAMFPDAGETILEAGDSMVVAAGRLHRMAFSENSELYELYLPHDGYAVELADIERIIPGQEREGDPAAKEKATESTERVCDKVERKLDTWKPTVENMHE